MKNVICNNSITEVTEDETDWIITFLDGSGIKKIPKERDPFYPVALVTKWHFNIVDEKRIRELDEAE